MKKALGVLAMGLVVAAGAAQAEDVWIGVRGGLSIPKLTGGNDKEISSDYHSITALNAGLTAEYCFNEHYSVVVEATYAGQGGERKGMQPVTGDQVPPMPEGQYLYADFKNKSELTYLEVPIMAKYQWKLAEQWVCYLQAGPYIGFLLDATQKTSGQSHFFMDKKGQMPLPGPAQSMNADTDVQDSLNDVNVGIAGGIGAGYLLTANQQLYVDIRGEYGFTSLQKNTDRDGDSHTGCGVFSLGYKYKF